MDALVSRNVSIQPIDRVHKLAILIEIVLSCEAALAHVHFQAFLRGRTVIAAQLYIGHTDESR